MPIMVPETTIVLSTLSFSLGDKDIIITNNNIPVMYLSISPKLYILSTEKTMEINIAKINNIRGSLTDSILFKPSPFKYPQTNKKLQRIKE